MSAGGDYRQIGSHVSAYMGSDTGKGIKDKKRGNVIIDAKNIDVINNITTKDTTESTYFKQKGLTVSASNSLVDGAKGVQNMVEAGKEVQSDRARAMAALSAVSKVLCFFKLFA
ncbi:hypothetical protein LU293_00085 [Moraxella nasovis]|uniref:hypothetical protein n=1 Tax=Moraxella nasovis TaxID=2904121 RepID=UPI001F62575F|nr:hypothetical protein [Moraxella nasovis]UNU73352.1 hypothetical protein LU293_00085 [Moraxella nasovis]